jgi:C_GCAxxG_C_C family probable redox protein
MDQRLSPEDRAQLRQRVHDTLAVSGNCAQTSFAVLEQHFDLEGDAILKALTSFPGVALRGETCGAVTGCLMAIGLVQGRDRLDDRKGYLAALVPARRFCRRFEEANGSTACGSLLEAKLGRCFDLADRGDARDYLAAGGPLVCSELIADAVEIAAELLEPTRRAR